jgi:hypothetical protein
MVWWRGCSRSIATSALIRPGRMVVTRVTREIRPLNVAACRDLSEDSGALR